MPCYTDRRCEWGAVPRPTKQNFRENVRMLIQEYGIDDLNLARAIGASPSALSRWLNGTNEPSFEDIDNIAKYFGTTPQALFIDPTDNRTMDINAALRVVAAHVRAGKIALNDSGKAIETEAEIYKRISDDQTAEFTRRRTDMARERKKKPNLKPAP